MEINPLNVSEKILLEENIMVVGVSNGLITITVFLFVSLIIGLGLFFLFKGGSRGSM